MALTVTLTEVGGATGGGDSFTGAFGTASTDRWIVLLFSAGSTSTGTITINGVTATKVVNTALGDTLGMAYALVPTGTSGTIVINSSGGFSHHGIYAITGATAITLVDSDFNISFASSTFGLDVVAGGVAVGVAISGDGSANIPSWSAGLTNDGGYSAGGTRGQDGSATNGSTTTLTCTFTGASSPVSWALSFAPVTGSSGGAPRILPNTRVGWKWQNAMATRPSTAAYGVNAPITTPTLTINAQSNVASFGPDTGYMEIQISKVAVAAVSTQYLLELGSNNGVDLLHYRGQNTASYDPTNGTLFNTALVGHNASNTVMDGIWYHFPLSLPLNFANSMHNLGIVTTTATVAGSRVYMAFNSRFQAPEYFPTGSSIITYVSSANVVEGTTSDGSWISMTNLKDGSLDTRAEAWHWQMGLKIDSSVTVMGDRIIALDLAYGNSTVKTMVIEDLMVTTTASEQVSYSNPWVANIRVPMGSNLYCRSQSSGAVNAAFLVYAYGVVG